ncbi:hypothetical protein [Haloactinomyces albus]|uniref:Uncharacterized protein n=1 Tax=Haloactinomyces albus TaxID=1352928 RepID=A0AAE3ZJ68_9ACTN|nr:hypothetical protein [Haloactinomyces albus]MDR7304613.1 hypothetical protein [Haloactinomyces albus]
MRVSPRARVRIDAEHNHNYTSTALPDRPPCHPHALYLADRQGRYRLLAFDLDAHRHGADAVATDLARLRLWLSERAIPHVVAHSGTPGSRHVWVGVPHGASAELVSRIARALSGWLPTLDTAALTNPRTGCVRPPGARHRCGHVSALDPDIHGVHGTITPRQIHTAAAALERGTTADVLHELLVTLQTPAPAAPSPGDRAADHPRTIATDESGALRLTGAVRDLGDGTLRRLAEPAPDGDYSAHGYSILLGLALARLRLEDATALAHAQANIGMEHFRSRAESGRRVPRSSSEARSLLERQWNRAVLAAAHLPEGPPGSRGSNAAVVATVAAIQAAADAVPWRWAGRSGPADRAVLDALCRQVLEAGRPAVDIDVRRWAQAAGHSRSAVARAAHRLASPDDTGHAWLVREHPGDRTQAATWRLLGLVDQSGTQGSPAPGVSELEGGEVQLGGLDSVTTETSVSDELDAEVAQEERRSLKTRLERRLEHVKQDVWTYGRGLGHHLERTRWALLCGLTTLVDLMSATGYGATRVWRHIETLCDWGLAVQDNRGVRACGDPSGVAAQLGVLGRGAERVDEHVIDRIVRDWWDEEERWRRRPGKRRTGAAPGPTQVILPVVGSAGWRQRLGRFPTRVGGRADYKTARDLARQVLPGSAVLRTAA